MSESQKKRVTVTCALEGCNKTKEVKLSQFLKYKSFYCCDEHKNLAKRKQNLYIIHENYAEILLNSKKYGEKKTVIDLEDVERCKEYYWFAYYCKSTKDFYVHSTYRTDQKQISLHRFLMNCPEDKIIDHTNHITLDNRKSNLKICSSAENAENRKQYDNTATGYRNVYKTTGSDKYRVQIKKGGKFFTPNKLFDTPEQANKVAIKMRNELFTNNVLDRVKGHNYSP